MIIKDIIGSLPLCGGLIDKSHIGNNIVYICYEIDLSSYVCEIVHNVDVLICRGPMLRECDLHLFEVYSMLPVYLVFVTGNNRDSPSISGVNLRSEIEN